MVTYVRIVAMDQIPADVRQRDMLPPFRPRGPSPSAMFMTSSVATYLVTALMATSSHHSTLPPLGVTATQDEVAKLGPTEL